jgi:hypothetical protein
MQLGAVRRREAHIGQHVGLGVVEEGRELAQLRPQLIGDAATLGSRRGDIGFAASVFCSNSLRIGYPDRTDPADFS